MIEKITIKGKDFSLDEARELYVELHEIFGSPDVPYYPSPYPIVIPSIPDPFNPPYWITCTTSDTKDVNVMDLSKTAADYFLTQ